MSKKSKFDASTGMPNEAFETPAETLEMPKEALEFAQKSVDQAQVAGLDGLCHDRRPWSGRQQLVDRSALRDSRWIGKVDLQDAIATCRSALVARCKESRLH